MGEDKKKILLLERVCVFMHACMLGVRGFSSLYHNTSLGGGKL